MKKAIFPLLFLLLPIAAKAQDTIFYKTGDEVQAQVTKITGTEVEYKKWSNLNGPTYTSSKSELFMIKFQNGEKEVFKDEAAASAPAPAPAPAAAPDPSQPSLVVLPPDARNAEIIQAYNSALESLDFSKLKQTKSNAPGVISFWNIHPESNISNSEIELKIVPCSDMNSWIPPHNGGGYYLKLSNKTGDNIYIDKENCFRINPDGISESYFDNKVQTVSQGGQTGAAVNLGGVASALGASGAVSSLASAVTVGGSSGKVASTTYIDSKILSIPPFGSSFLQEDKWVDINSRNAKNFGGHENFSFKSNKGALKNCEVRTFTHETSPYIYRIIITYSTKPDFSKYSKLELRLYVQNMLGIPYHWGYIMNDSKHETWIHEQGWGKRLVQLPESGLENIIVSNWNIYCD